MNYMKDGISTNMSNLMYSLNWYIDCFFPNDFYDFPPFSKSPFLKTQKMHEAYLHCTSEHYE